MAVKDDKPVESELGWGRDADMDYVVDRIESLIDCGSEREKEIEEVRPGG